MTSQAHHRKWLETVLNPSGERTPTTTSEADRLRSHDDDQRCKSRKASLEPEQPVPGPEDFVCPDRPEDGGNLSTWFLVIMSDLSTKGPSYTAKKWHVPMARFEEYCQQAFDRADAEFEQVSNSTTATDDQKRDAETRRAAASQRLKAVRANRIIIESAIERVKKGGSNMSLPFVQGFSGSGNQRS